MTCSTKIEDVNLDALKKHSYKLAQKVRESGYVPEHVLYVERAGLFVAYEVAKYFDCGISGIYASRSGTSVKSKAKIILRYLPKTVTDVLRNIEVRSNIHVIKKDRHVYIERQYPANGKKILIVDDAIDTGYSLNAVLNFLKNNCHDRRQIKIAVLTTTRSDPKCRADISLFEQVSFAFPWSYTSKEYNQTWSLYEKLKASLSE